MASILVAKRWGGSEKPVCVVAVGSLRPAGGDDSGQYLCGKGKSHGSMGKQGTAVGGMVGFSWVRRGGFPEEVEGGMLRIEN